MREIYMKATDVVVCLGNRFDAGKAIWLLVKLHALASSHSSEELAKRYMLEKNSASWLALTELLSHPWFNR